MNSSAAKTPTWRVALGVVLVAAGLALLALPRQWIEGSTGTEAHDDGLFELLIGLAPLLAGAGLLIHVVVQRRRSSARSPLPTGRHQ
jgi:uncharacterized membrane protein HdeD (DUF308 family)